MVRVLWVLHVAAAGTPSRPAPTLRSLLQPPPGPRRSAPSHHGSRHRLTTGGRHSHDDTTNPPRSEIDDHRLGFTSSRLPPRWASGFTPSSLNKHMDRRRRPHRHTRDFVGALVRNPPPLAATVAGHCLGLVGMPRSVSRGSSCCKGLGARSTGLGRRPRLPALRRAAKNGGGGERACGALSSEVEREKRLEVRALWAAAHRAAGGGSSSSSAIRGARGAAESGNARSAGLWLDAAGGFGAGGDGGQERRAARCAAVAQESRNKKRNRKKKILVSVDLWLR